MDLENYYKLNFALMQYHKYSLTEIENLMPWERDVYVGLLKLHIEEEQLNTEFDLSKKIHSDHIEPKNNIIVKFDATKLTKDNFQILVNLSEILQQSGEVGEMELEIFKFNIKSLDTYERELINVK